MTAAVTKAVPPGSLLFNRACTVQVADLLIPAGNNTGLDVWFEVKRGHVSPRPQPNTATLRVWNLSPQHRKAFEASTVPGAGQLVVPVVITAGYAGRVSTIFAGEMRGGFSAQDGPDILTELTTGDGDDALTQARLTLALGPGTTGEQGLRTIVRELGVDEGNLAQAVALLNAQPLAGQLFAKGAVFKGSAADVMTSFCRSAGLEWSVQHGKLQVTAIGQPLAGQAILLDADHGLIGAPTIDTKGILHCETLMIPDIAPGVPLSVQATNIQGGFRVLAVETRGDTRGDDWGHCIEAKRY
jgi:hypothetical protein